MIDGNLLGFKQSIENNSFHRLEYIKIKLTDACNLRCEGCEYWQLPTIDKLSSEILQQVIKESAYMGAISVHLSGGEPTLRKDLVNIVRLIQDTGMSSRMVTNGTQLNRNRLEELLQAGLGALTFSLDSAIAEENDIQRGRKGSYKIITDTIQIATDLKDSYGVQIGINTVVTPRNLLGLPKMVRLASELGVDWLRFSPIDKSQYGLLGVHEGIPDLLSEQEIAIYNEIVRPSIGRAIYETGQTVFPEDLDILRTDTSRKEDIIAGDYAASYYREKICFSPFTHITIFPSGDVMPCCKIPLEEGSIGNVNEESLRQLVQNHIAQRYRERVQANEINACRSCTMKLFDNQRQYDAFQQINFAPGRQNEP